MPSRHFQGRLIRLIQDAVAASAEARRSESDHMGLVGQMREIAAKMLIRPILPPVIGITTGKVIDSSGLESSQSKQCDIILYDKDMLPPIMFGEAELGYVPVESCLAVVEVKTKLNDDEFRKAMEVGRSLAALKKVPGWRMRNKDGREALAGEEKIPVEWVHGIATPIWFSVLAFEATPSCTMLLEAAQRADPQFAKEDVFLSACIIGRQSLVKRASGHTSYTDTKDFLETRNYLAHLAITVTGAQRFGESRAPNIDDYFV